jgi:molybdate transport repressor ModE-like protein
MRIAVGLRWFAEDVEIDPRLIALLGAIGERGSLKQAIAEVGLSYRHAWERLGRLESVLGERLVDLERGRGATLTGLGKELVGSTSRVEARLRDELKRAATELNRSFRHPAHATQTPLRICASHDFALDRLAEQLPRHGGPAVVLRFQGSLDALVALTRKRCDVAGFHVPVLPGRGPLLEPFRPSLRNRLLRLVHFADRRQGLIVAENNPLAIRSLADLPRLQARFVNRQVGSGTRVFFDALLASQRIRPAQINGYRHEEFTHAAVAAMIASGAADVAFGIEAAAAQLGLSFVPLAAERYFLAMRESVASQGAVRALLQGMQSRWFRRIVRGLPGYAMAERSVPTSVTEAFAALPT